MFGIFKKKLKEVVNKIAGKFEGKREDIVEKEEKIKEELEKSEVVSEEKQPEEISKVEETEKEEKTSEQREMENAPESEPVKEERTPEKESKTEVESKKKSSEKLAEEEIKTEVQKKQKPDSEKEKSEELESLREEVEKELPKVEEEIKKTEEGPTPEEIKEEIAEELEKEEEKPKKKESFFRKFVKKITEKKITEDDFNSIVDDLKITLLQNDVAFEVVEKIIDDMKKELVGKPVKRGKVQDVIIESLKKSLLNVLKQDWVDPEEVIKKCKSEGRPALILFVGFNGVGKTTTLAKFGYMLKNKGYKVVFAAGDTFRAASIEQIEVHGKVLDIPVIKHKYGADSAAVIFDAVKHAKSKGYDVVLADTAGRSHSNVNLMDELKKVVRVNNPDMKILVIDSLTGNDAVEQARKFDEFVNIDGIILTKFDVNDRGGAALSVGYITKKPILYVGVGQDYPDLMKFEPEIIVRELLLE